MEARTDAKANSLNLQKVRNKELIKKYNVFLVLGILLVINIILTQNFFRVGTIWNIAIQSCTVVLVGMGMNMVISTGGIDISVGSSMAIAGMIAVKLLPIVGVALSIVIALIITAVFGMITGFFIAKFRLQPIIISLAMMMILRGVAQVMNNGMMLSFMDDRFSSIGNTKLLGEVPIQLIYILVAVFIVYFVMSKTRFGMNVQSIGDNIEASKLVGINVNRNIMLVYVFSAVFAAMAGLIETARMSAADGNSLGKLSELDAIAAVAVGGTSISGGRAMVIGTLAGGVVMELINITVNMNNIPNTFAQIIKAIIIIIAVIIQQDKRK